jgi:SAM-dependent methyltransferase
MGVATVRGACPLCGPEYPGAEVARGPDFEYRVTGDEEFRFVRCMRCGVIVLDPRPADGDIARLYPPEYEPYRFDTLPSLVRMGRDLVQRRKVDVLTRYAPPGGVIVDVGCGGGALLRLVRRRTADSFRLVGWDYPGPHLERLAADGYSVVAAPIEAGHVPRNVDLFVLNQVIEHVPDPDRLLAMLAGALRPGGHIIIETPDTSGLDARVFSTRHWGGYHTPRHMVLFNEATLRALVQRSRLHVVETAHLASPAFWVQSLHHALLESSMPALSKLCTLRNLPLTMAFSAFDVARSAIGPTSNQRLVARKPA